MKNKATLVCALLLAASNAFAYIDGGVSMVTGPNGYRGSKLNLLIGTGNLAFEPSLASYTSDSLDKTYRTYAMRFAVETDRLTLGASGGLTPEVNSYSNKFVGGDVTISLTPGGGGKSRLAGPGARSTVRGGEGVTRIDVGASLKQTWHEMNTTGSPRTDQTEYSLFAGAKVLVANLSASYTGYAYGDENVPTLISPVPGHSFIYGAQPKSSVNTRLDLPFAAMVTPFVGYTGTKYKGGVSDSSAYLFGAYLDLNMIAANITYQLFDDGGNSDSFVSLGVGLKI